MRPGLFVTGTDTGIGKTIVSACLVHRFNADYWKPAQTGLATDPGDTQTVAGLVPQAHTHPPTYSFQAPLSPEAAAAAENTAIDLDRFALPEGRTPIIVEGAGGVLAPLNAHATMATLMQHLGLPVLLVARGSLGTINHTLLSLEALRARGLPIAGIAISGPDDDGNGDAIERHGGVRVVLRLPRVAALTPGNLAKEAGRIQEGVLF